jgi:DNA-binding NtrC family response regulator
MERLRDAIARVAPIPSAVLIVGESGSGKELVAREIHRLSGREKEPFIAVNCAALPENLVESELFGHERGAFTGAHAARKGAFESAGKGTLFLDEVGELPAAAQAKLLRVLEEHAVVRVGAVKPIQTPARVIAATHRDLEQDVASSKFRQDLLYRLNAHVVRVPALRDRLSDLSELVDHLLASVCARFGVPVKQLGSGVLDVLASYDWKRNNVRELRNAVERMVIDADGTTIAVENIPSELIGTKGDASSRTPAVTFVERKAEAERQIIVAALSKNDWHITRTAEELGLADHASLLKIMRRHGLKKV